MSEDEKNDHEPASAAAEEEPQPELRAEAQTLRAEHTSDGMPQPEPELEPETETHAEQPQPEQPERVLEQQKPEQEQEQETETDPDLEPGQLGPKRMSESDVEQQKSEPGLESEAEPQHAVEVNTSLTYLGADRHNGWAQCWQAKSEPVPSSESVSPVVVGDRRSCAMMLWPHSAAPPALVGGQRRSRSSRSGPTIVSLGCATAMAQ